MTDPYRPSQSDQDRQGSQPTQPRGNRYQLPIDPAYSGQGPTYGSVFPPPHLTQPNPTEPLPQYWLQDQSPLDWQHGQPPSGGPPSRPERPKTPRWLWVVATAAVLLVLALVIALVVTNSSAKKETAVPPLPAMPSSKTPPSTTASSAPTSTPPTTTTAAPSTTTQPSNAGAAATVVYNVTGEGRAISISYVDNDGVMQVEFNVALPWSKEVTLPKSVKTRANVSIVNIGHEVSCSVTVDGVQGRQRTGVGLTMCDAAS
jgi:hypothetical protein